MFKKTEAVEVEPVTTEDPRGRGSRTTHPAFAQISVSRVQGNAVLYGSDFKHQHFMRVRIARSELQRDLSRDWHYAREDMIEVDLSEAQWATFVSSPNAGGGVPCTLHAFDGQLMPRLTLQNKTDKFKQEVGDHLDGARNELDALLAEIEGMNIPKAKKAALAQRASKAKQEIEANMPFVAEQFGEHVEKTVEKAKVEINAYMTTTVQRAGLEALLHKERPLQIELDHNESETRVLPAPDANS